MDMEDRLKRLQTLYSYTSTLATTAKNRYQALQLDSTCAPASLALARAAWQQLEQRKIAIVAQMVAIEELELETVI